MGVFFPCSLWYHSLFWGRMVMMEKEDVFMMAWEWMVLCREVSAQTVEDQEKIEVSHCSTEWSFRSETEFAELLAQCGWGCGGARASNEKDGETQVQSLDAARFSKTPRGLHHIGLTIVDVPLVLLTIFKLRHSSLTHSSFARGLSPHFGHTCVKPGMSGWIAPATEQWTWFPLKKPHLDLAFVFCLLD